MIALQWALDRRGLTPSEKLVLVTLVHSWQRNFGSTKITIGLICRQTGMHRASVFRALNTLEERHLITRHHDRRHGRQSPTEYVLRLEHAELELATSPEPNPQPALPLPRKPTEKQLIFITSLAAEKGLSVSMPDTWQQAMDLTDWLKAQPRRDKENPGPGAAADTLRVRIRIQIQIDERPPQFVKVAGGAGSRRKVGLTSPPPLKKKKGGYP